MAGEAGDRPARPIPRPFIVPVFIPQAGCPRRCVFCDQHAVTRTPEAAPDPEAVRREITSFLAHHRGDRSPVEIAFYGGNFLGLPEGTATALLDVAGSFVAAGRADGIRFSTRPDTVDAGTLKWIAGRPVSAVEVGAQSMDDRILAGANRGHTAADTVRAVELLRAARVAVGLQMMVGLPGEDVGTTLSTGRRIAGLSPDFTRIYPLLVLRGSPLEGLHRSGRFVPLTLAEAVDRAKQLYLLFAGRGIPVIRMGLQLTEVPAGESAVVAGPYHPAFGERVLSEIFLDRAADALAGKGLRDRRVRLRVHPRSESKLRGEGNRNLETLTERFRLAGITVAPDRDLPPDRVAAES